MDFNSSLAEFLPKIGMIYIPLLLALCVHEWAHGFMAKMRGDDTAERMGRLTLNPAAHIDPIGTVVLPLLILFSGVPIFFGWAKPVPFDPRNLKNPRVDSFWIALAGPLSNVILALLATLVLGIYARLLPGASFTGSVVQLLVAFMQINLFLAVFNMLPLHPLDGGKVIARFLPIRANLWLERNEHMTSLILLGLIILGALAFLALPVAWATKFLVGLALGL
ncbi:MAG: site-2 protease family protein [Bdellovibrionaceae bacterium]|nr:site-2 protease family protein [Pseudobdellovibrionaceae bacterium]MBX3034292.1 site-2 protease family protein [Pseudobdellovibrionaceae bacterium]